MSFVEAIGTGIFLFIFPGFLFLLFWLKKRGSDYLELLGLSPSFSLSFYALIFMWGSFAKLKSMILYTFLPLFVVVTLFLGHIILKKSQKKSFEVKNPGQGNFPQLKSLAKKNVTKKKIDILFIFSSLSLIFLIFLTRWQAIKDMVAPAWGDSVHHTLIIKLILNSQGLFKSWQPYAPLESFSYHFGVHVNIACWAWLTGLSAHKALLYAGQFLNGLAVIALYPLTLRLTQSRWVSLGAMLVAGLIFPFPAYFVNWGRYTHLTAMIILPSLMWVVDSLIDKLDKAKRNEMTNDPGRKSDQFDSRFSVLLIILISGLFLTHYSIFILGVFAVFSFLSFALLRIRFKINLISRPLRCLILAFLLAGMIISPWLVNIKEGKLANMFFPSSKVEKSIWQKVSNDFWVWSHLDNYFPKIFWILSLVAFIIALILNTRIGWLFLFFSLYSVIGANLPASMLPGRRLVQNAFLVFSLYLPISILLSWGAEALFDLSQKLRILRKKEIVYAIVGLLLIILIPYGINYQLKIVDPFFQMVTVNDLKAFEWIRANTPKKSKFLINGFLIYEESAAAGSDAGWWLAYFTGREALIPPLIYNIENLSSFAEKNKIVMVIRKIIDSKGNQEELKKILKEAGINYLYLGDKRGQVAYEKGELIPEEWLKGHRGFKLVFRSGKAQVWKLID
ncbi:MAG: hypothetical protein N3B16_04980 [Candidatus Aminicenantes bacterium]|nr:hypothetical protein [Candidatus Aminicenantes bacterium]